MGSPNAAYRELMHDYIQESFKFDKEFAKKYNDNFLYSLSTEEMENVIRQIHPDTPLYNAMKAGIVFERWCSEASTDQLNAACAILEDYLDLFHIREPKDLLFNNKYV